MLASANVCPTGYNGVMAPGMQGAAAGMGFHGSGHATSHANSHSAHQYNNPIAFWQARQFGGQGSGVAQGTTHSTTGATHQGPAQEAKMAEKIVSELQVRDADVKSPKISL